MRIKPAPSSAFTLIEVVISASLMAVILASSYACLNAAFSSQKLLEPRLEVVQNARVALSLMAADLRCACPLSKDIDLLGMHRTLGEVQADNLDFGTHNYTPRRAPEGDFCQVSFFLEKDPTDGQFILWRRRNPRPAQDPLSRGNREEIARGVRGLRFEYYDGLDWYDSWGDVAGRGKARSSQRERSNLDGLPDAVRITLWFDSNPRLSLNKTEGASSPEPSLMFQTVARLNLAARVQQTFSAGASDATSQPASAIGTDGRTP